MRGRHEVDCPSMYSRRLLSERGEDPSRRSVRTNLMAPSQDCRQAIDNSPHRGRRSTTRSARDWEALIPAWGLQVACPQGGDRRRPRAAPSRRRRRATPARIARRLRGGCATVDRPGRTACTARCAATLWANRLTCRGASDPAASASECRYRSRSRRKVSTKRKRTDEELCEWAHATV